MQTYILFLTTKFKYVSYYDYFIWYTYKGYSYDKGMLDTLCNFFM